MKCISFSKRCGISPKRVRVASPTMEVLRNFPDVVNGIVRQSSKNCFFNLYDESKGRHFRELSIVNLQMIGVDPEKAFPIRFGLDPLTATEQITRDINSMRVADFFEFKPQPQPQSQPQPQLQPQPQSQPQS